MPGILRSIYAYHTQSRGWSDVGYNFLVDRFGRIWEGRYGGVDRPVVGAHTLGYNDDSFAMSAIGNFELVQPSQAMIEAYAALFAWKLSLHGVDRDLDQAVRHQAQLPGDQRPPRRRLDGVPGQVPLRQDPRDPPAGGGGPARAGPGVQLESNLGAGPLPDLVVRRASDKQAFVVPIQRTTDGTFKAGKPIATGQSLELANRVMNAGDWDRNGYGDIMFRHRENGYLYLYPGQPDGTFGAAVRICRRVRQRRLLAAVGDMTGDGWPDLMGQPAGGDMRIYPGLGIARLAAQLRRLRGMDATKQIPVGLWDADGAPDTIFRKNGAMAVMRGNGPGGLTGAKALTLNSQGLRLGGGHQRRRS